ncbi:hypothetical protein SNEBB_003680, partial [Seison nebaliae]
MGRKKKSNSKNIAMTHKEKGNDLFKNEKYEDAIEIYKKARKMLENVNDSKKLKAILHQNIGACLQRLGKYEQVIEQCDLAIQSDVEYAKAYWRKSQILAKQHNEKEALFNITISAILEKFSIPETLVQAEIYLKVVVKEESRKTFTETSKYPLISRSIIYDYFSSFYRDIFCYPQMVIPLIQGNQREVESSETSELFFQNIFDPELCSIRDTYLSGAFSDANEIANVVENLKLFIRKQDYVNNQSLRVVRNLGAAFGFLGTIYVFHRDYDEGRICFDKGLLILKRYPNDKMVKFLMVSLNLKYSHFEITLESDKREHWIDEAQKIDDMNLDIFNWTLLQTIRFTDYSNARNTNKIIRLLTKKEKFPSDIYLIGILKAQQLVVKLIISYPSDERIYIAEKELLKLVEEYPGNIEVLNVLAKFYQLEKRHVEMLNFMERIKKISKHFVTLYEIWMVEYRMTLDNVNMKEIHSEVQSLLMREKNSLSLHKINSQILMKMNDFAGVLVALKKLVPLTKYLKQFEETHRAIESLDVHLKALTYLEDAKINDIEELRGLTAIEMRKAYNT